MVTRTETYVLRDLEVMEDVDIDEANPNINYGLDNTIFVQDFAANDSRGLFQIKLPSAPPGAGKITQLRVGLYVQSFSTPNPEIGLRKCLVDYVGGFGDSLLATRNTGATWNRYNGIDDWATAGGAEKTEIGIYISDRQSMASTGQKWFDITTWAKNESFTWESVQNVFLRTDVTSTNVTFVSGNDPTTSQRPRIEVTYEIEPTTNVEQEDNALLSFEANPANPEQPKLMWKRPKNVAVKVSDGSNNGAYLIIRSTSTIQDYDDGSLLKREDSALEYIDASALTDGQAYYYRVLICDEANYVSGTGTGAMSGLTVVGAPQWTNEIVIEKPDVATFVESGANYTWNVWEEHTVTTTANAPSLAGVQNEAYQYDWQGDGSETGWVELETPANSHSVDYRYTSYGGGSVTPKVRIRNNLGLWSSQTNLGSAITLTRLNALAECRAAPMSVPTATVLRLRADESQDQNADGTITKYEFQVQRLSDSKYWDGANSWQVGAHWEDETTTSYVDVPAAAIDHSASETYTCKSRVTGASGVAVTSSAVTVTGTAETATDIRTGLSSDTNLEAVSSQMNALITKTTPLEGTTDVRIVEGVSSEVDRIEGVSHKESNALSDVLQLFTWATNQTLLEYEYDEPVSPSTKSITFRITRFELRRRDIYRYHWSIEIDVISKT
jgi:hypothetical protein